MSDVKAPTGLLIGGQWITTATHLDVVNPASLGVLSQIGDAGVAEGLAAVKAAADAFPAWAATAPRQRGEILRRAFDIMSAEIEDCARLIALENGKAWADALAEATYAAEFFRWFAGEAGRVDGGFRLAPGGDKTIITTYQPIGPALMITPWNFPAAMATRKLGPALAAGCTAILKPAAETPLTALWVAEVLQRAGVPDGVVNVITTSKSGEVSAAMLADPRVATLSFTGSTFVGKLLLHQSADRVLRASMELGGNAPFIVLEGANVENAVAGAMISPRINQSTTRRIDQHRARLHLRQRFGPDHIVRRRQQWTMQAHDIALAQEVSQRQILHASLLERSIFGDIMRQHIAAKTLHDTGKDAPDLAGADHANGLALQVKSHQAIERKITFPHAVISPVRLAVQRKNQRHRVFGHGKGRIGRHPYNCQPFLFGRFKVNMVEPGAAGGDQLHPARRQPLNHRRVHLVVDEDTNAVMVVRQTHCFFVEVGSQIVQLMARASIKAIKKLAVIVVSTKKSNFHKTSANPFFKCLKTRPPATKAAPAQTASIRNSVRSGNRCVRIRSR